MEIKVSTIIQSYHSGTVTLKLNIGRVNALELGTIDELETALKALENDAAVSSVVITGEGSFFSYGFNIPALLNYSKGEFTHFVTRFTELYSYLFLYPKPVVAALNGHTIAGGCILALACDARIMASGKPRLSLNELTIGATFLAGATEMLRFWAGNNHATQILYSGQLYSAEESETMGLVQHVVPLELLMDKAYSEARGLGEKNPEAFASMKSLLRTPIVDSMKIAEPDSIKEFVNIWYSYSVQQTLRTIKIH